MKRALKSPANQYVIIIIIFLSLFFCSPTIQFNGGLLMCFDCQVLLIQLSSSLLPAKVLTAIWQFLLIQLIDILLFSLLKNHSGFPLHTIRKVNFLSKNSILTNLQHFHELSHNFFFFKCFSWNQSCQPLKSPKPQHFHEFFIPKNRSFFCVFKVDFLDKY